MMGRGREREGERGGGERERETFMAINYFGVAVFIQDL